MFQVGQKMLSAVCHDRRRIKNGQLVDDDQEVMTFADAQSQTEKVLQELPDTISSKLYLNRLNQENWKKSKVCGDSSYMLKLNSTGSP